MVGVTGSIPVAPTIRSVEIPILFVDRYKFPDWKYLSIVFWHDAEPSLGTLSLTDTPQAMTLKKS